MKTIETKTYTEDIDFKQELGALYDTVDQTPIVSESIEQWDPFWLTPQQKQRVSELDSPEQCKSREEYNFKLAIYNTCIYLSENQSKINEDIEKSMEKFLKSSEQRWSIPIIECKLYYKKITSLWQFKFFSKDKNKLSNNNDMLLYDSELTVWLPKPKNTKIKYIHSLYKYEVATWTIYKNSPSEIEVTGNLRHHYKNKKHIIYLIPPKPKPPYYLNIWPEEAKRRQDILSKEGYNFWPSDGIRWPKSQSVWDSYQQNQETKKSEGESENNTKITTLSPKSTKDKDINWVVIDNWKIISRYIKNKDGNKVTVQKWEYDSYLKWKNITHDTDKSLENFRNQN